MNYPFGVTPAPSSVSYTINPPMPAFPQLPQIQVQTVTGEEGAKNVPLGPNSSGLYLDSDNPRLWIVRTDAAGVKTVFHKKIVDEEDEKPLTIQDLYTLICGISEKVNNIEERMNSYGQSYSKSTWQPGSTGNNRANNRNDQNSQKSDGSV